MATPSDQAPTPPDHGAPTTQGQPFYPPARPVAPRRNPWKWLVLGCGGIILLASCGFVAVTAGLLGSIANGSDPTPVVSGGGGGQANALPTVGQTATRGNWSVTLDKVERAERVGSSSAAPQGIYLITYVTLKNVGKQSYSLNDWDFSVNNPASGAKYKVVSAGAGQKLGDYQIAFIGQTVQPELSSKNAVAFDVPPAAGGLVLEVQGIKFALPDR